MAKLASNSATLAVDVAAVSKHFRKGAVTAVDSATIQIKRGEIYGLIGPDGAGKTTLLRMLTTLLLPDSGSISVAGLDVVTHYKQIRTMLGYMPGRFSLYQDLTVHENLHFFATLFNTTIAEQYSLIEDIYSRLEPFKNRKAGALSGGMKQKLALCCALVHRPEILVLDEPTTGVDPVSRREFWQILTRLKEVGITVVVSTPYMDEALQCDRIALMDKGVILDINTPEGIIANFPTTLLEAQGGNMAELRHHLTTHPAIERVYAFGSTLHLSLKPDVVLSSVEFFPPNSTLGSVVRIQPTIEDCFIRLMSN